MMYHDKLYAVKNDRGEFAHIDMDELTWETGFATLWFGVNEPYAKRTASDYGGHVVELVEAPAKEVVSEAEAEMLKRAKNEIFQEVGVIYHYAKDHDAWRLGNDIGDRLMRAYVNGWVVEKPKRWNVKVSHTRDDFYRKLDAKELDTVHGRINNVNHTFTDSEIIKYGLQDCEKTEVPEC
jgi:hypothetical protein